MMKPIWLHCFYCFFVILSSFKLRNSRLYRRKHTYDEINVYSSSERFFSSFSRSSEMKHNPSVAIIGGGLAGLGCAFYTRESLCNVTVFDHCPVGTGGGSAAAAGMMHPFSPQSKLIWKGLEGFDSTMEIIKKIKNENIILKDKQIMKPSFTDKHLIEHTNAIKNNPELVSWLSQEEYSSVTGHTNPNIQGALKIKKSAIINTPKYLQSLWNYLSSPQVTSDSNTYGDTSSQVSWEYTSMKTPDDIICLSQSFDIVFLTCGSSIQQLWPSINPLPITPVRGQSLLYESPHIVDSNTNVNGASFRHALLCGEYIVPTSNNLLICGATHEYKTNSQDLNAPPELSVAKALLNDAITKLYPPLAPLEPIGCIAGVRVNRQRSNLGKLPLVAQHSELRNVWMLTGLGSRGLLYHALVAKMLVAAALDSDTSRIPKELLLRV